MLSDSEILDLGDFMRSGRGEWLNMLDTARISEQYAADLLAILPEACRVALEQYNSEFDRMYSELEDGKQTLAFDVALNQMVEATLDTAETAQQYIHLMVLLTVKPVEHGIAPLSATQANYADSFVTGAASC
jgi:hypothetical protein